MKLAFYIGSLNRGGAERVISNLANFFYHKGYEVVMVTKFKAQDEYPLEPNIKRILADITEEEETESRIRNFFRRLGKLRRIWKQEKPDLIISFIKKNNFMAILSSFFLHTKVVVSVRSAPEREYGTKKDKILAFILFRMADGIVLQTKRAFSFFPRAIQRKAILLRNPISQEFLQEAYGRERKKEIVTVGRIDSNKNQILLIKAFEKVMREFEEWTCLLYGDGDDSEKIQQYVKDNGMEDRVQFMGRVDDVREKIEKSAIFVLPSKVEGMPNALIEAMALGMTVISTDCPCGGPAELIQNMENGILFDVDDEQALSDALKLLMKDEVLRVKLGSKAAKIQEELEPDRVHEEWQKYIDGFRK